MIMMIVLVLTLSGSGKDDWANGKYSGREFTYNTLAECIKDRHKVATYATRELPTESTVLISKCGTPKDTSEFEVFFNSTKKAPVVTPGRDSS